MSGIQGMENVVAFSEGTKRTCLTSKNLNTYVEKLSQSQTINVN